MAKKQSESHNSTVTTSAITKPHRRALRVPGKGLLDFFREVKVELTKVVWPTRPETIRLTLIVIMVTVIVGFFVVGIDYLLALALGYLTTL